MSSRFSLKVKNCSSNPAGFALFQGGMERPGIFTLAWFSKYTYPGTVVEFEWSIDFGAFWSRPGAQLKAGLECSTEQYVELDISGKNHINLSYDAAHDAFHFNDPYRGDEEGRLFTLCDSSVPASGSTHTSIGIGMGGKGCFIAKAEPNIVYAWTPRPHFYLVTGEYKEGEIIDVPEVINSALEIKFESGFNHAEAYLNEQNILVAGSSK